MKCDLIHGAKKSTATVLQLAFLRVLKLEVVNFLDSGEDSSFNNFDVHKNIVVCLLKEEKKNRFICFLAVYSKCFRKIASSRWTLVENIG